MSRHRTGQPSCSLRRSRDPHEVRICVGGSWRKLAEVGVDSRAYHCTIFGVLGRMHTVRVQHSGQLDPKLVSPVEAEDVVEAMIIVGSCDGPRDDKLPVAGRNDRTIAVVSVLVEQPVVLFVDAYDVFNQSGFASRGGQYRV